VEEVVMSLMKELVVTIGDALRLSSDLMRHKLAAETNVVKRSARRFLMWLAAFLASLVLAAVGTGFFLYGAFVLLAGAIGIPGVAGLVLSVFIFFVAVIVAMVGRSLLNGR
jgi:hypothetical protein